MPELTSLRFADVAVGAPLPVFDLPLTLQRLVMEAGVNRDFTPTHHDTRLAIQSKAPAAYANTLLVMSIVEAGLRQWMGPEGVLLELDVKMLRFNEEDTTLRVGGVVRAVGPVAADERRGLDPATWGRVDVDVWIDNERGRTIEGTASVALVRDGGEGG